MRVIIDTNIFVSAFVFKSETATDVVRFVALKHVMLFSESTFVELKMTLLKPKFTQIMELTTIKNLLKNLMRMGEFIAHKTKITVCRDPKDNKFLELAVAGKANCIVTGDKDLLVLHPFRGINIISPADFIIQY